MNNKSNNTNNTNNLFPVFLKLEQFRVLIIGGGKIGLEKITAVLNNNPATQVTLIAINIIEEIKNLKDKYPNLILIERAFNETDLNEKELVIVAVNVKETSKEIKELASKRKILTNVADTPDLCDFYLGSIVQKGAVKIAISTNGQSPTLAKRIKEILNESFPDEIHEVLENLKDIRGTIKGDINEKIKILNEATTNYKNKTSKSFPKQLAKVAAYSLAVILLMIIGHLLLSYVPLNNINNLYLSVKNSLDENIGYYFLGGALAQLIDGALGMAYGVSVTTFLLSLGIHTITPAVASASMHASEIFTTGASSIVYMRFKNINKKLFRALLLPGIAGAIIGSITVSFVNKEYFKFLKPLVSTYTLILGILIITKALKITLLKNRKIKNVAPIAGAGGFLDSVGGGGWGPIVTSSLISRGGNFRYAIGSSHLAKFFVAIASTITFFVFIGIDHWQIIFGLVIGDMITAPFSIYLSNKIPTKPGLILVGSLVIIISLKTIITSLI